MRIRLARSQAERLVESLGLDRPPIDVRRVAASLGIGVTFAELGDEVSGLLLTRNETKVITVNAEHHEHRQRFSIAHELGHFYLGHQFEPGEHVHVDRGIFVSQRGPRASMGQDPKEVEANQFASCLLIPSRLIRKEVGRQPRLNDDDVDKLAIRFKVSVQAMTIRLATLGLL